MEIKTNKVMIFRIGSIGDTIVALPCFHLIKKTFPKAHISLLTNIPRESNSSPLIEVLGEKSGFVDNVIEYPNYSSNPFKSIRLLFHLRQIKMTQIIYLMPNRSFFQIVRDYLFFRIAGVKKFFCIPKNKDLRLPRIDPVSKIVESESKRLTRCLAELGEIDLDDQSQWDLNLSLEEHSKGLKYVKKIDSPFLAIHVGAHLGKKSIKDWGMKNWIELIHKFRSNSDIKGLMIVGSKEDKKRAKELIDVWGGSAVSCCGKLSPRESAAALSHASIFCGHDSGPLHLAQSVGTKSLGLFGNFNKPNEWHPIGKHVKILHDIRGIKNISVNEVLSALLEIMSQSSN